MVKKTVESQSLKLNIKINIIKFERLPFIAEKQKIEEKLIKNINLWIF